jgi:undecaprenyl-phosphate 4-deoxy-4-formamido-L-arabinose transferase
MNMRSLSVVVPVFNSEPNLPELVRRGHATLSSIATRFEMILVNDDSSDESWRCICELAADHAWIRGINLSRNFGQHNALLCGIRAAQYDTIVTIDDDLQNPPEEIPRLLRKMDEGFDVVYGTPKRQQHGLWRNLASTVTKLALQSAMGAGTARDVSAFRAFRTALRDSFQNYRGPFVSIDVLLTWGTTRFAAVQVQHDPRTLGVSNYTWRKLVRHALDMTTGFSTLPLQLASVVGFAFTLFGLLLLVYVLGRYFLQGTTVPGFPFLAAAISIFSGAQLFALGVIGEYLARMHFRMMERPPFAVRERTDDESLAARPASRASGLS